MKTAQELEQEVESLRHQNSLLRNLLQAGVLVGSQVFEVHVPSTKQTPDRARWASLRELGRWLDEVPRRAGAMRSPGGGR